MNSSNCNKKTCYNVTGGKVLGEEHKLSKDDKHSRRRKIILCWLIWNTLGAVEILGIAEV